MEKYIYDRNKLPIPVIKGREDLVEFYYKAWELAFSNIKYVETDGWKPILSCMPEAVSIWLWDSCFMEHITKYSNGTISAFNNLDNMYRLQRNDGFIAMAYKSTTEKETFPGRINPPLCAWVEWGYYLVSGDVSRFDTVLPVLEGLYDFIEKNRRRNNGLYWFEDSGSSGMDNSPRSGFPATNLDGNDVCFIDLACQQAMSAEHISKMYSVVGREEKREFYQKEKERICDLINQYHWNEKGKFYYDFFARDLNDLKVKHLNCKTVAAVWTILSGAAKKDRLEKTVEHFFNTEEFYTKIPFATLSKDDLNYDPTGGYWLGGVWPPTNYALLSGLKERGFAEKAHDAAVKFLDGMLEVYKNSSYHTIWEAYSPEEFLPSTTENGEMVQRNFVGWGGLGPITILIENIIGLGFDAQNNSVYFDISDYESSGIKNIKFNGGYTSILCESYNREKGKTLITVDCEKEFMLYARTDYNKAYTKLYAQPGSNKFYI